MGNWRANNITCYGENDGVLNPNPGRMALAYTWKYNGELFYERFAQDGNFFTASANDFRISSLQPGVYELTIIDHTGCELVSDEEYEITQPPPITLSLEIGEESCDPGNDGYIIASAKGGVDGFSYIWNDGSPAAEITGLSHGKYSVTVSDALDCKSSAEALIPEPVDLKVTAVVDSEIDCYGYDTGKVAVNIENGRGGYIYIWSTGEDTERIDNARAGFYSVRVVDRFKCAGNGSVTLSQPEGLWGEYIYDNIACPGDNSGNIYARVEGGVKPYTYQWLNSHGITIGNTSLVDRLPADRYQAKVLDRNNCPLEMPPVTLTQPEKFAVKYTLTEAFCPETNDGDIRAEVSGGTPPYAYQWQNVPWGTSPNIAELRSGNYSLKVTDARQCEHFFQTVELGYNNKECLRIPNAFSPNNDSHNDYWEIFVGDPNSSFRYRLHELYPEAIVEVYSGKWGMLLFRSKRGYTDPWDGKYQGKYLPVDSYVYRIILNNHTKPITGNVSILR